MKTKVIVTTRREGWHCWPQAPEHRSYLRASHRHLFHIKVEVKVSGPRKVEFHDLLDEVDTCWQAMKENWNEMGQASCEEMASRLEENLNEGYEVSAIEVWEDGECGARVEFD